MVGFQKLLCLSGVAIASLGFAVARSAACGLEFDIPTNHFEGVNEFGFTSIWDEIGRLDLGGGQELKLITNFRSNRESTSPYLGKGWILAPLESSMVQVDENRFMMLQPNGAFTFFSRAKNSDTLLRGQGVWMAEIKGDIITAWPDCGGKMVFAKGRLISMEIKDKKIDLIYSGNAVSEIRKGGETLLRVDRDPQTGEISGLSFQGRKIAIEKRAIPHVQVIAGQRVVKAMEMSLHKLKADDGVEKRYEFSVNEKLEPVLSMASGHGPNRLLSWDPLTRLMKRDNGWTYDITSPPPEEKNKFAAIGRTDGRGGREFWHDDPSKGKEITTSLDGETIEVQKFTSGELSGRIRQILVTKGGRQTVKKISYDENGEMIRASTSEKVGAENLRKILDLNNAGEAVSLELASPEGGKAKLYTYPKNWAITGVTTSP